jgi:Domain of unknown function (DUF5666)
MNPNHLPAVGSWLRWGSAVLMFAAAVTAGCGGSVGVGGTGAYASGPVEGFGSIFVGGIEFDDATASVFDDDGAPSTRAALRLGMGTEVDSGAVGGTADAPTATATSIRMAAEVVGLAHAIDAANGTLTVFDQAVKVDALTVFDAALPNGLASVADGAALRVHGSLDAAAGVYKATRIEPAAAPLAAYKVRGTVKDLDTAARTFRIGAALFSYSGAQPLLAPDAFVRVSAATTQAAGRWVVVGVAAGARALPDLDQARLRGPVTAYTSQTSFSVNGQPVDARTANFTGPPGPVALGVSVVVDGAVQSGVLVARSVRLDNQGGVQGNFKLKGAIESIDPGTQTLVLKGLSVYYGSNGVQYSGGNAAQLAVNRSIEVRGVLRANGTQLDARRIDFLN